MTRHRHGVLTAEHTTYLREVFIKACQDFGATLVEYNGQDNHIHLLVQYPPKAPITALANSPTAVPARRLRPRHQIRTHRQHLRPPSYFTASSGSAPLQTIKQYVQQQRTPAANPGLNAGPCAARFPVVTGRPRAAPHRILAMITPVSSRFRGENPWIRGGRASSV